MAISYIICLTRDGKIARDGSLRQAGHREGSCGLSIHCLAMKSLPDMDISYGNHTEYKTPTIAGQLMLLGGICGACASWRSTLFQLNLFLRVSSGVEQK